MGMPCTDSEKGNQFSFPVLGDLNLLKLRSCPSVTKRLPSERQVASCTARASPRFVIQDESIAASKFACRSLTPDVLNRSHETAAIKGSSHLYKTPQALRKSQNDRRHAPIVTSTLGKREEVSPVRMQPCPPSTSRDKDRHTGDTFRERKFKGEYHRSALSSEGKSLRKREEHREKRSNPEIITVDNFIVDLSNSATRPLIDTDVKFEFDDILAPEEDYEIKKNIQERSDVNICDCITQVWKGITLKQANSFVETDCKMSRTVCKVTQYYDLRTPVPSPLDEFAQRQLGCNLKLCRENLELNESFAPNTCKDTAKEIMINNWLIGIPRVK